MANNSTFYLQADEIDHITIRYTDFGEKLNRKPAIKKILDYFSAYDDVADALKDKNISKQALEALDDKELYEILVIVRTVLLRRVK